MTRVKFDKLHRGAISSGLDVLAKRHAEIGASITVIKDAIPQLLADIKILEDFAALEKRGSTVRTMQ